MVRSSSNPIQPDMIVSVPTARPSLVDADDAACPIHFDLYPLAVGDLGIERVNAPKHEKALEEIIRLERDPKTGLIDHAPKFSKDCADAVAGVVHGLTYRREIWVRHGVPMIGAVESVIAKMEKSKSALFSAIAA